MIDFPATPTTGQIYNSGTGPIYIWDGVAWNLQTAIAPQRAWEKIGEFVFTAATQQIITDLGAFRRLRYTGSYINSVTSFAGFQFSLDNGATWKSGATDYNYQRLGVSGTAVAGVLGNGAVWNFTVSGDAGANLRNVFNGNMEDFNQPAFISGLSSAGTWVSGTAYLSNYFDRTAFAGPCNALRLAPSTGTFTGTILLEGVRG